MCKYSIQLLVSVLQYASESACRLIECEASEHKEAVEQVKVSNCTIELPANRSCKWLAANTVAKNAAQPGN